MDVRKEERAVEPSGAGLEERDAAATAVGRDVQTAAR
jgi:hypothetical protein